MKTKALVMAGALSLSLITAGGAQAARDYISIVGSSTVYPFSTVVAEQFGKSTSFKTPKIESTGTGGGFKLFCSGVGVTHADMTNASRAIKDSEIKNCVANGVTEIVEVKVGYDGIVIANSKKTDMLPLTSKDIFLALAKQVPDPKNPEKLIDNPYTTWQEVNASLPAVKIEVLGPPPTSGTRDAFVEMAMEGGAAMIPTLKELKKADGKAFTSVAHTLREDGAFIEAGENDNLIVQKLQANAQAFGIFGFSFLDQNGDVLQGSSINGEVPTFETIADGKYPVSRPLFFYVKKAHVGSIPGMAEYLAEFSSEKAWGEEGYLTDKGMIPMPKAEREKYAADIKDLKTIAIQ